MSPEGISINWENHHETIVKVLEMSFEKSSFVDCTLTAEGQYIKAHRIVLSACSTFFRLLFNQDWEKNPIVVFTDISFQELKSIIDYIYRGKVKVPAKRIDQFLNAAAILQIRGLQHTFQMSPTRKISFISHKNEKKNILRDNKEMLQNKNVVNDTVSNTFPSSEESLPLSVEHFSVSDKNLPLAVKERTPIQNESPSGVSLPLPIEVVNQKESELEPTASEQTPRSDVLEVKRKIPCKRRRTSSKDKDFDRIKTNSPSSVHLEEECSLNSCLESQGPEENELQQIAKTFPSEGVCSKHTENTEAFSNRNDKVTVVNSESEDVSCDKNSKQNSNEISCDPDNNQENIPQHDKKLPSSLGSLDHQQKFLPTERQKQEKDLPKQRDDLQKARVDNEPQIKILNTFTCENFEFLPNDGSLSSGNGTASSSKSTPSPRVRLTPPTARGSSVVLLAPVQLKCPPVPIPRLAPTTPRLVAKRTRRKVSVAPALSPESSTKPTPSKTLPRIIKSARTTSVAPNTTPASPSTTSNALSESSAPVTSVPSTTCSTTATTSSSVAPVIKHSSTPPVTAADDALPSSSKLPQECNISPRSTKSDQVTDAPPTLADTGQRPSSRHSCPECGKSCRSPYLLEIHKLLHKDSPELPKPVERWQVYWNRP